MSKTVYIETSIVSYLVAQPSRDVVLVARQELTQEWWNARHDCELFISDLVLQEASAGDPVAAAKRTEALRDLRLLEVSSEAIALGDELLRHAGLPPRARVDALHVAVAVVNGLEYLLTWNCKHIANATLRRRMEVVCRGMGFEPPIICTPEELLED